MFPRFILCTLAAASVWGAALAQGVTVFRPGDRVDPAAVAAILGGGGGAGQRPKGIRTRGLQLLDAGAAPAGAGSMASLNQPSGAATAASVSGGGGASLSLPVQFGFDSAKIFPEAREQLDAVAEGIKMIPQEVPVVIEGHTDATGNDAYNLDLSRRRAEAVKQYLVGVHGIDASRLRTLGQGKREPIDPGDPYGPVNRRVQFRGG
ncbi:MAG: OmpA family protein [Lautropia sp.]